MAMPFQLFSTNGFPQCLACDLNLWPVLLQGNNLCLAMIPSQISRCTGTFESIIIIDFKVHGNYHAVVPWNQQVPRLSLGNMLASVSWWNPAHACVRISMKNGTTAWCIIVTSWYSIRLLILANQETKKARRRLYVAKAIVYMYQ
jgi:hypothetical protein